MSLKKLSLVSTYLATLLFVSLAVIAQESRTYVYDATGQLVGVVANDGSAILYSFDEVGNRATLTIRRLEKDGISAILPGKAPSGVVTTVAITGSGLAKATSIIFVEQGITAVITGSPRDTLISAAITVSSTVSPGNYGFSVQRLSGEPITSGSVVLAVTGAPTLTNSAPDDVLQGQTIHIWRLNGNHLSGTTDVLFDTNGLTASNLTASSDGTLLTARLAVDRSAPLGTTGMRVQTPAGISNRIHLEIKPGHQFIQYGETVAAGIDSPGEVDLYTFDGAAGDQALAWISSLGSASPKVGIVGPNGTQLCTNQSPTTTELFCSLDASGSHTLSVENGGGTASGNYGLHLQRTNGPGNAPAITFGDSLTATIDFMSELDAYTFSASTGDRILARMNLTSSGLQFSPRLQLFRPDGSRVCLAQSNSYETFMELLCQLDASGTYTLIGGDRFGRGRSGYGLHLQRTNAPGGALPISFGDTVTGTIDITGKRITYTVAASSGDTVAIKAANEANTGFGPHVKVYRPDGSELCASHGFPSEALCVLDTSGIHTVSVGDGNGPALGNYSLHVQRTNAPGQAAATNFGDTLPASINFAAELDAYTFNASPGDTVLAKLSLSSSGLQFSPRLRIFRPDGSQVCLAQSNGYATFMELLCSLDSAGTYTVIADDRFGRGRSSYGLHLQRTNAPGGALPISFGDTVTGTVDITGKRITYTVAASSGDTVVIKAENEATTGFGPYVKVYRPDGSELCASQGFPSEALCVLDTSGIHTISVGDGSGPGLGNYSLHVQRTNAPSQAAATNFGDTLPASIGFAAELDAYTFNASPGDTVLAKMSLSSSGLQFSPRLRIFRPDGSQICLAQSNGYATFMELLCPLDSAGTYTVIADDRFGRGRSSYGLHLQRTNAPGGALPIEFGDTITGTIDIAGRRVTYIAAANDGDALLIKMARESNSNLGPQIKVYRPDGSQLCATENYPAEVLCVLNSSGIHTISVGDGNGPGLGNYSLHLQRTNAPGNATAINFGDTLPASIDFAAELDAYTFSASPGDTVVAKMSLASSGLQFSPRLKIFRPDGSQACLAQSNGYVTFMELLCPLEAAGTYILIADDRFGLGRSSYELHLQRN